MTVVMTTKMTHESLSGDNCACWTIEVQRWENVIDRPVRSSPSAADLPREVREALSEWLEER